MAMLTMRGSKRESKQLPRWWLLSGSAENEAHWSLYSLPLFRISTLFHFKNQGQARLRGGHIASINGKNYHTLKLADTNVLFLYSAQES